MIRGIILAEAVGEWGAVAGGGQGLCGLACGAGAFVLLFNGYMVFDLACISTLQVFGESCFVEGDRVRRVRRIGSNKGHSRG